MSNIILNDNNARNKISSEFNKNFLVEAGAGSGKTTCLVQRMVNSVKSGAFKVNEIVAITFTKKAASELRERFQTKLENEKRESEDPLEQKRLDEALQNINQCFLGTVHSFCSRLLRERPVEAGIDPEFKEIDSSDEVILSNRAWDDYISILKSEEAKILKDLDNLGISPLELKESFLQMNEYPEIEIISQPTVKPDLNNVLSEIDKFVAEAEIEINKTPLTSKGYDDLQKTTLKVIRLKRILNFDKDADKIKILRIFDRDVKITQYKWNSPDIAKEFKAEVDKLRNDHIQPFLIKWQEYCHYYIMEFLTPAVKYYIDYRTRLSFLNFQDLLMKTASMLKSNSEVRLYFQNKYKCLLVDEFQDTDPIQAELIFYLAGEDTKEKDWQKLVPKAGALFVVGDPKQSIYRFRRADIDIYNLVKMLILKGGGEVLELTTNFRSLNSLGSYLNPIFKEQFVMDSKTSKYQAKYAAIETVKEDVANSAYGVKKLVIPAELKKKEIIEYDADEIARIIRSSVDGSMTLSRGNNELAKASYKDFMILVRYKKEMDVYARALEKYHIPVQIAGSGNIGSQVEIKELITLIKFLDNIENQVYLVAVLRGLFFGISDNLLYHFKMKNGLFNIFIKISEDIKEEFKGIDEAFKKLQDYYNWTRKYSPVTAFEKIVLDLGVIEYASLEPMNNHRLGGIYYILEKLKMNEAGGITEFSTMVENLETLLTDKIEEELDIFCEENVVRLMNIHKSKGLEAPVVFLANPAKKSDIPPSSHIERTDNNAKGYFTIEKNNGEHNSITIGQPLNWTHCQNIEAKYLDAEEKRIIYVAATRAKNLLIISSLGENNKNPWKLLLKDSCDEINIPIPKATDSNNCARNNEDASLYYEQMKLEVDRWSINLKENTYNEVAPTDLKDTPAMMSIDRKKGGGTKWGTAVHKIMELLVEKNEDISAEIDVAIEENELNACYKEEMLQLIKDFKETNMWERIQNSREKYTEVPFSIRIDNEHPLYLELKNYNNESPIILNGIIDIIFKEDGQWVVADYKTDRLVNDEDYEKLEKEYQQQIKIYGDIIEEMTGEKVKSKEIIFLYHLNNEAVVEC